MGRRPLPYQGFHGLVNLIHLSVCNIPRYQLETLSAPEQLLKATHRKE